MSRAHSSTQSPHTFSPATFRIPDRYKVIRPVGKGAYGIVVFESVPSHFFSPGIFSPFLRAAKDLQTEEKVAIKKTTNAFVHQTDMKRTLREMRILSRLQHENV